VKDHRPHAVELIEGREVDVLDDHVKEEGKVDDALRAGVEVVAGRDGEVSC
jgi:hypothetical protein